MTKTPEHDPPKKPETTLQTVLDALSVRSAFALPLNDRIDRYHLIEATRAALPDNANAKLVNELLGRQMETLLSLANYATRNPQEFKRKATAIGQNFDFNDDGKLTDRHLLLMMVLTALTVDARRHGIEVEFNATKSGKDGFDTPH